MFETVKGIIDKLKIYKFDSKISSFIINKDKKQKEDGLLLSELSFLMCELKKLKIIYDIDEQLDVKISYDK